MPPTEALHVVAMSLCVGLFAPLLLSIVPGKRAREEEAVPLARDEKGRIRFFDVARGVAIIAVVLIHVTRLFPGSALELPQEVTDVLNNVLRFAIAIFFISSGALLSPPEWSREGLTRFYCDKLVRLALPYALVVAVLGYLANDPMRTIVYELVTGDASVPFYFIIILFELYLIYPLLVPLARHRLFVYGTLAFCIVSYFIPFLWHWGDVPVGFRFLFFFVWGIYLGEVLREGRFPRVWWPWLAIVALFVGLLFFVGEIERFYNFRPFYGIAVFSLLYLMSTQGLLGERIERALAWVGGLSLWIFLTHYPLMEWLQPWLYMLVPGKGWALLIFASVVCVVASIALAWVSAHLYRLLSTVCTGKVR